jgi:uncharacterized YigZ family protein
MNAYRTLLRPSSEEYLVNKSRFIGYASPAASEEEALSFLDNIRQKHRDATHNCYAYTIGANMGIMRYSDDGEPGGTAGLPMMEVIRQREVCNCCVVVTRYFGGVLLGAGGLVRAYSHSCSIALSAARIVVMEETEQLLCEVAYGLWDRVQHLLRSLPVQVTGSEFTTAVVFTLLVRTRDSEQVCGELTRLTNGQIEILPEETSFRAWETGE